MKIQDQAVLGQNPAPVIHPTTKATMATKSGIPKAHSPDVAARASRYRAPALENSPSTGVNESLAENATYVRDRQTALAQGVDALPQPVARGQRYVPSATYGTMTRGAIREQSSRTIRGGASIWNLWE